MPRYSCCARDFGTGGWQVKRDCPAEGRKAVGRCWPGRPRQITRAPPSHRILIYSDGIPDAMRGDGEVFGAARLLDAVQRFNTEPLGGILGCLLGELRDWRGDAAANEDVSVFGFKLS